MKEYIIIEQHTREFIQRAINLKSREYELVNIATYISGDVKYYVAAMKHKKEKYNDQEKKVQESKDE